MIDALGSTEEGLEVLAARGEGVEREAASCVPNGRAHAGLIDPAPRAALFTSYLAAYTPVPLTIASATARPAPMLQ